jgi:plasmid stabilization system protein ParE
VSGPFRILIVSSAARAIVEAADWWVANRPKAPGAFAEELDRALQLLSSQPLVGAEARNVKLTSVRRIHLPRVHYHLYYRMVATPPTVEVLALWHTSRGTTPDLP